MTPCRGGGGGGAGASLPPFSPPSRSKSIEARGSSRCGRVAECGRPAPSPPPSSLPWLPTSGGSCSTPFPPPSPTPPHPVFLFDAAAVACLSGALLPGSQCHTEVRLLQWAWHCCRARRFSKTSLRRDAACACASHVNRRWSVIQNISSRLPF